MQVYYGHELLEVVGDDREQVGFKILVGRLYNAGLKIGCLQRQFEVDPKTMKRWGEACKVAMPKPWAGCWRGAGGIAN